MDKFIKEQYMDFGIDKSVTEFVSKRIDFLKNDFDKIDSVSLYNQNKVINAMRQSKVSSDCFNSTYGYGYNDYGRDTLEKVYSNIFKTEKSLVRCQITCGTHALNIALQANLKYKDTLYSPLGKPYDTLEEVIGIRKSKGSLKEHGINYKQTDLLEDYSFNYEAIKNELENDKTIKLVTLQRSRGYQTRPSFTIQSLKKIIKFIKDIRKDVNILVDNCYGEFVEKLEPSEIGADIVVGSLIKNIGGGIAGSGGYITGKKDLVENCAIRLTSPGLSFEVGPNLGTMKDFYQGLFFAPVVVASSVKNAILLSKCYNDLGFNVSPLFNEKRTDIVQAIIFKKKEYQIAFCEAIQEASCVDSFVKPVPSYMPGYDSDVIMASGSFVSGSSIELSADGPIREPYVAYFQGGLNIGSGFLGVMNSINRLYKKGYISLNE